MTTAKKTTVKKTGTKKTTAKETAAKKEAGAKGAAKKTGTKKTTAKETAAKKEAGAKGAAEKAGNGADKPRSMPKEGKDPKGGLTAAGRRFFAEKEGSHLKPGVKGAADTPEKMVRKGSFLRRHYANPRGPVVDEKGQPTRQALQAAAWGEAVPKSEADEKRLAEKGSELLEQYHAAKGDAPKRRGAKAAAKKG